MTDDARTIRFQLMMTEAEASAVEQWAAENGVKSRAEALRLLCEIGLRAAEKADDVGESGLRLENLGRRVAREISGVMARLDTAQGDEKERAYQKGVAVLIRTAADIVATAEQLSQRATQIVEPALALRPSVDRVPAQVATTLSPQPAQPAKSEEEIRTELEALQALRQREPRPRR